MNNRLFINIYYLPFIHTPKPCSCSTHSQYPFLMFIFRSVEIYFTFFVFYSRSSSSSLLSFDVFLSICVSVCVWMCLFSQVLIKIKHKTRYLFVQMSLMCSRSTSQSYSELSVITKGQTTATDRDRIIIKWNNHTYQFLEFHLNLFSLPHIKLATRQWKHWHQTDENKTIKYALQNVNRKSSRALWMWSVICVYKWIFKSILHLIEKMRRKKTRLIKIWSQN